MATINYATNFEQALQQKFNKDLCYVDLYGSLTTPTNLYRWVNANTIAIPRIDVTGYVDTDRDSAGNYTRNVDNSYELKTLDHDREFSTLIDPMDIDETNQALSVANISRVFIEEQEIPEMDKFMTQALYNKKVLFDGQGSINTVVLTPTNILSEIDKLTELADEAEVPREGRYLYVTSAIETILKQASQIDRRQEVTNNNGSTNRSITRLEDLIIKSVPSVRMKSAYDFSLGAVPAVGAKQVNLILIHPRVVLAPQKYAAMSMATPSALTKDRYFYYQRKYWDVFVIERKTGGLQINAEA